MKPRYVVIVAILAILAMLMAGNAIYAALERMDATNTINNAAAG